MLTPETESFISQIKDMYGQIIPDGDIFFNTGHFCKDNIYVYLMMNKREEAANKIVENDHFYTVLCLSKNNNDTYTTQHMTGSLMVKSTIPTLEYESVKCSLRSCTGDKDKVLKALSKYFIKRKQLVDEKKDQLVKVKKFL